MSCIVQSQPYLPAFGLLRQVGKMADLAVDLQQSDGEAIPDPPPLGLKRDPGLHLGVKAMSFDIFSPVVFGHDKRDARNRSLSIIGDVCDGLLWS